MFECRLWVGFVLCVAAVVCAVPPCPCGNTPNATLLMYDNDTLSTETRSLSAVPCLRRHLLPTSSHCHSCAHHPALRSGFTGVLQVFRTPTPLYTLERLCVAMRLADPAAASTPVAVRTIVARTTMSSVSSRELRPDTSTLTVSWRPVTVLVTPDVQWFSFDLGNRLLLRAVPSIPVSVSLAQ